MPRKNKKVKDDRKVVETVDADFDEIEDADEDIDEQVKDIFEEAQQLNYGRRDLARKLATYTDRTPVLSGGDIDAGWEYGDVGEESVGGQNPTPDQSVVDEEGKALGITYNDNEPLRTEDKLEQRDRDPWELNPASSLDYNERVQREFKLPVSAISTAKSNKSNEKSKRPTRVSATSARATTDVSRSTRNNRKTNATRGVRRTPSRVRTRTVKTSRTAKRR